ncbi:MAG TPA: TM0106 family RecB-like putative nuclease [Candidatus Tumulicola sp.]|jgi:uncharacterized protein
MQRIDGRFIYAASDLNNYLECKRLSELSGLVARHVIAPPPADDERAELIQRKGDEHEKRHLQELLARHGPDDVVRFDRSAPGIAGFEEAQQRTLEAMRAGARIIYQATFFDGQFIGHADFLRRVETPSDLGDWSYEVLDTKLALSTKPYFLIQLCNYSEHLERLQGAPPKFAYIVLGDGTEMRYRLHDYVAYYRRLKSTFLEFVSDPGRLAEERPSEYPHRRSHCEICPWDDECSQQRRDDDHLSGVAWMRRAQIVALEGAGIATVGALAKAGDEARPQGMPEATFIRLRRQAALQIRGRDGGKPVYELLHHAPPLGFAHMPAPAPGDVFFDMEGDPVYEPGKSLEYLFGCWLPDDEPKFRAFWGLNRFEEKRAFERFVDFIVARRQRYPAMHVYHYASYEKTALRRLAQAHCTREAEIDDLLRGEVLVDLFAVVRQALAISEERYGLKNVEKFYQLRRGTDVKKGAESIVMFERWLLGGEQRILDDIEAYNKDDCESAQLLRDWLLERRTEAVAALGLDLPLRPVKVADEPCHAEPDETCTACKKRAAELRENERVSAIERELLEGIELLPQTEDEYLAMPESRRMRFLLANLLAYHRREEKPGWWEYFDRRENADRLREFDREAIGELRLRDDILTTTVKKSFVYTYEFPEQHRRLRTGDSPHDPLVAKLQVAGTIVSIDSEKRLLELKRGKDDVELARAVRALIPAPPRGTPEQRKALKRIAESFVAGDLAQRWPATFDLLAARDPRVSGKRPGDSLQPARADAPEISAVVRALDRSYLFIQGPPGSGKTTKGASVICDLLQAGKRVGIQSTGHKAMHTLLHKVEDEMHRRNGSFRGLYKYSDATAGSEYRSELETPFVTSAKEPKAFEGFSGDLAAGTSWLFAREELTDVFDYLFIDEAGQVALADALAVSPCAKNVVLLGDPSQLAQVSQGVHPPHAGDSVLQHLLGDAPTVPPVRGIFLEHSYRMQPDICRYISDAIYEGRLEPDAATALHATVVDGVTRAGLEYAATEHEGNAAEAAEEAVRIVREVQCLLRGSVADSDGPGELRPMTTKDIIVVTPYNAQRLLIERAFKAAGIAVDVGTVDKFQGREAAVVFYSMAASSGEDVSRDLGFLLEKNRFNVAVSRARALCILVCSPRLLDVNCRTPEQMALANLLCALVEDSKSITDGMSEARAR